MSGKKERVSQNKKRGLKLKLTVKTDLLTPINLVWNVVQSAQTGVDEVGHSFHLSQPGGGTVVGGFGKASVVQLAIQINTGNGSRRNGTTSA